MTNPEPRPALRKAGTDVETIVITDGFGNIIKEYSMDRQMALPSTKDMDYIVDLGNAMLNEYGLGSRAIDEVALLFGGRSELAEATRVLVRRPEVTHFNGASDRVKTNPLRTEYDVDYEFFSIQERAYRVEAMSLTAGNSPLHTAFYDEGGRFVHVSFKVPTVEEYYRVLTILASRGLVVGQKCESTYGLFSYWRTENQDHGVWLKPRVNIRDGI